MKLPLLQVETERLMIRPFQNDDYESWLDGFNKRLPSQYKDDDGYQVMASSTKEWFTEWIRGFAKAAQNMLTLCLQQEFENKGISVTAIHPGKLKTEIGAFDAIMTPAEGAKNIYDWVIDSNEDVSWKFIEPGVGEIKW